MENLAGFEVASSILLIKAVLATLSFLLFIYYKYNWERAKKHLQVHFFYARWRVERHACALGVASFGFAAGFLLELFGSSLGMGANVVAVLSGVFEAGALFSMLWVFFNLALEDVPHMRHAEAVPRRHYAVPSAVMKREASSKKKPGRKKAGGRKAKRR